MKAIVQTALGGPEVLQYTEVVPPVAGPDDVVVRVRAASVNPADWKIRAGAVPFPVELPHIPGFDLSGVVESVGERVSRFQPGDEVFGMPRFFARAYAEYARVPEADLAAKPATLDHVQAAGLASVGLTAWQGLVHIAGVKPGQRVLVHAAAGGVGHVAVQIAKALGAHVIGTARASNHDFLRELGADETIDYSTVDFADAVRDVDVVLDNIGDSYGARSLPTLAPGGILVSTLWDRPGVTDQDASRRGVRLEAVQVAPSADDLEALAKLDQLRVHVQEVFPLHEAALAHRTSETARVRGKLVLIP
ncbi:NADP-dependent oxidoreductase [Allorhizocola rhizosphaerae]|uniref:NADP-dependent oxidoreductase n=1 Tax=Allorhizocola rhizosphaerae TaxID=1872709 RepID=UPI000E3B7360|nr:NADP-dependent oxidoreductase [Allorhizocola rhizosphaerae]